MNTSFLSTKSQLEIPDRFIVHHNYPNPFNPITTISYELPENSFVNVTIFDMLGREVKKLVNGKQDSGYHQVNWDGTHDNGKPVSSGVYLYFIRTENAIQTGKMILLK